MSLLLGLTGSIGTGKSTTAQMFRDAGIPVWDADASVHDIYANGGTAVEPVGKAFPGSVVDGAVSRPALSRMLRADEGALARLEAIVHPLVARDRAEFIATNPDDLLVFDIPLLFETASQEWLDRTLVVTVPEDIQRARVLARPGMTEDQFDMIRTRQMPDARKRALADHVIETRTLDDTRKAVRELIADLRT